MWLYARDVGCPGSFFFSDPATTEIYTLPLPDALPISPAAADAAGIGFDRQGPQRRRCPACLCAAAGRLAARAGDLDFDPDARGAAALGAACVRMTLSK